MPSVAMTCVQSMGSPLRGCHPSLPSCKHMQTSWIPLKHPPPLGPLAIRAQALTKDVHDFDEWKQDLHQAIMLDCNKRWSWDFTQIPMVPKCLFWPAEQPYALTQGFGSGGDNTQSLTRFPIWGPCQTHRMSLSALPCLMTSSGATWPSRWYW